MADSIPGTLNSLAKFAGDAVNGGTPVPHAVAEQCRNVMLNAAAVALAGAAHPEGVALSRFARSMGGNGRCTIIGMGFRTSPVYAALVNGTLVRLLDFDDNPLNATSHPTAAVFPAVLALGEMHGASGARVLSAFAAGTEIVARLSEVHGFSSAGTVGATAACGALLGLTEEQLGHALGIAVGSARANIDYNSAGVGALLGGGLDAMNGVMAALIASEGVVAAPVGESLESLQSAGALVDLGRAWQLTDGGISIHAYPCHPASHTAIDAALGIIQMNRLNPADISNVHVGITADAMALLPTVLPADGWQARSCLGFITAATLCHGAPLINFFSDVAVSDEGVRAMMERISVEASVPESPLSRYPAELQVTLHDGRVLRHRVDHARGTPAMPMDAEELEAKFLYCTRYILPQDHIEEAITSFRNIDQIENVTGMVSVLGG